MEKIGFIGAYDKTDLLVYMAKVLVDLGNKVIVIDTTTNQKAKYIIPSINPTTSYITQYEGVDIAVGLYSFTEIEKYLGDTSLEKFDYDYALIDIDNSQMIENFKIGVNKQNYFVTSFDIYSLKKGIEILSGLKAPLELTKVLFSEHMTKEDDEYLNFLSLGKKINWKEEIMFFPYNNEDNDIIIKNQRISKIKLKDLSTEYKDDLAYMIAQIASNIRETDIRKIIKQL